MILEVFLMLCFCNKCGRIVQESYGRETQICDCCNNTLKYIPDEFLIGKRKCIFNDERKDEFVQEYIKTSPEFDQYLFDHRDEILANQSAELNAKIAHGKAVLEGKDKGNKFGVSCPYCHATNVRRITVTSKAIHTSIFGIFSMGRNSKNYHCDHCGSDF